MKSKRSACLLVCVLALTCRQAAAGDIGLPVERKIAGLALVWQEANYNFAYFDRVPDLAWEAEFERAIGRVMATRSDYEYIREIQRFVALLGEAHTNVEPGDAFRARFGGHPAVELEEIERRAVIVNTSRDFQKALPVGSMIVAIDGTPVDDYLRESVFPYMSASTEHYLWRQSIRGHKWRCVGLLMGEVGSSVTIEFQTPDGSVRKRTLQRLPNDAEVDWLLPSREAREIVTFERLDGDILYFALNTFNDEEVVTQFEAHLDDLPSARGVILDVRNNGGGNSRNGWYIGRHFSDVPLEVSHWKTRTHTAVYKAWGRYSKDPVKQEHAAMNAWYVPDEFGSVDVPERTFTGPVVVLVGSSTYSAAEDFLSYMRAVPQCVFVGGASAGSTGQPLTFEITGGVWVGITSKRDAMPDGTEFVGYGVQPDVEAQQTVAAYREGRDVVLERALEVLKRKMH